MSLNFSQIYPALSFAELPQQNELYSQVEKMFCDFHKQLKAYQYRRYISLIKFRLFWSFPKKVEHSKPEIKNG